MRHSTAIGIMVPAALGCWLSLQAQSQAPVSSQAVAVSPAPDVVLVPAGTPLGLELQDSLNTEFTKKGDSVSFKVTPDVSVGGRVAIPRETAVDATVAVTKRGGPARQKGEIRLTFDRLILADGTILPVSARLTRVGRWNRSSKITPTGSSDRDVMQDLSGLFQMAGIGALAGAAAGSEGAVIGMAAGVGIGLVALLLERGPDINLPPGIMFQIELTQPLKVPVAPRGETQLAASGTPLPTPPSPQPTEAFQAPAEGAVLAAAPLKAPLETDLPDRAVIPTPDTPTEAPLPSARPAAVPTSQPAELPAVVGEQPVSFKTEVNLVMVEVTVRDARGAIYIKLKAEDFLVLEDGVEQEIRHFTRDELPLAVALVIDRSGSVAPVMGRLRRAAQEMLSQLKPVDQVALFTFDSRCELQEELTTDRQRITDGIATVQASGGTNIKDALYRATQYLAREAPSRRRAIIVISDNQETVSSLASESQVIRTALEAESVVYSIKVEDRSSGLMPIFSGGIPRSASVRRITEETGGEIIDTRETGSVESAMQAVISRLKLRFTIGYQSRNTLHDGAFRRISVRLTDKAGSAGPFTVYHRRGYYAPRPEQETTSGPGPNISLAAARRQPSLRARDSSAEQDRSPRKPFTNDDVLKLVQAGFGEEVTLEAIRKNECRFDTSAEGLLKLKDAGVSEKIILAILSTGRVPSVPAAPRSGNDALPALAGVYVLRDGKYVPMEFEQAHWRPGFWGGPITTGAITKTTLITRLEAPESHLWLSGSQEILLVCEERDAEVKHHLLRAEEIRKGREFRMEFQILDDGSRVAMGGARKSEVHFTVEERAPGRFILKLPELGKGQFALMPPTDTVSGKLYTFGVR